MKRYYALLLLVGILIGSNLGCTTLAKSHIMGVGSDAYATVGLDDVGIGFDWSPRGGIDSRLRLKYLTLGSSLNIGDGVLATPVGVSLDVLNGPLLHATAPSPAGEGADD